MTKKTIILIACSKTKLPRTAKAEDLYQGALFKKTLQYAKRLQHDEIYILSSKYGLVALDQEIAPYNLTLKTTLAQYRMAWTQKVINQLEKVSNLKEDHYIIFAGLAYRRYLLPRMESYSIPFENIKNGRQMHILDKLLKK